MGWGGLHNRGTVGKLRYWLGVELPVHVSATVLDRLPVHYYGPQLQREKYKLHKIINQYNILYILHLDSY